MILQELSILALQQVLNDVLQIMLALSCRKTGLTASNTGHTKSTVALNGVQGS
jgi:hypothetical protein